MTKDELKAAQIRLPQMADGLDRAALYYLVNKASWMGQTLPGGISNGVRATRTLKHGLHQFDAPKLSVECADFQVSFARHPDLFAYIDPPYLFEGKARPHYGEDGKLQTEFDHQGLFDLVKDRGRWMMSQQDNAAVRALYAGFPMVAPKWTYRCGAECRELLIFSKDRIQKEETMIEYTKNKNQAGRAK